MDQDILYWEFPEALDKEIIDLFLHQSNNWSKHNGTIGKDELSNFRSVICQQVDEYNFLNLILLSYGIKANNRVWNYNIIESHQCELLTYDKIGDKYNGHVDTLRLSSGLVRKLTILAFLNDNYEGGNFFIMMDECNKQYIETKKGSVIVFPSHILHGVEPIIQGTRQSVVSWIFGPDFR